MSAPERLVIGISGASGVIYGLRLLEPLMLFFDRPFQGGMLVT